MIAHMHSLENFQTDKDTLVALSWAKNGLVVRLGLSDHGGLSSILFRKHLNLWLEY